MAKICFEIPDDLIILKGAAVVAGWTESGKGVIRPATLADTFEWDQAMLFREGLRRADMRMSAMWQDAC